MATGRAGPERSDRLVDVAPAVPFLGPSHNTSLFRLSLSHRRDPAQAIATPSRSCPAATLHLAGHYLTPGPARRRYPFLAVYRRPEARPPSSQGAGGRLGFMLRPSAFARSPVGAAS